MLLVFMREIRAVEALRRGKYREVEDEEERADEPADARLCDEQAPTETLTRYARFHVS